MQLILDTDEAWSIMSLVISQVLDQAELSEEGAAAIRRWRGDRVEGTGDMAELTVSMNEALGSQLDERTQRLIRRKGWYVSTDEIKARSEMRATSQEMRVLTTKINDDFTKMLERKQKSQIRKPDWR
jgi:hypothetical protein